MSELEKARRVIAKHDEEERAKQRLKDGDVVYVGYDSVRQAALYAIKPVNRLLSPVEVIDLLGNIAGIGRLEL